MDNFMAAWEVLKRLEGGKNEVAGDTGGATNWGVSLRYLRAMGDLDKDGFPDGDLDHDGDVDREDVFNMTEEEAKAFALQDWTAWKCQDFQDPDVATRYFTLAWNMGPTNATRILQRALRACGRPVTEDGHLGPITMGEVNHCNPATMTVALRSEAAGQYRVLAAKNPALGKFLAGWESRAYV